jgi:two-component system response regulator PilR (NtrC family)
MQVKLLRAIQEKHVRRVGATTEEPVNVRIICATHQDLRKLMDAGRFRQDLFFRIHVIEIHMPALRECGDDIADLARRILARLAAAPGAPPAAEIAPRAIAALQTYDFPGNVRELENILERALALHSRGVIDVDDLQLQPPKVGAGETAGIGSRPLQEFLDDQERQAILDALHKTRFNRTAAARILGVTFRSLRYRMERLGLNEPEA